MCCRVSPPKCLIRLSPAGRCEAQAEVAGDHPRQAAALEVFHGSLARGVALQCLTVIVGGGIEQRIKRRVDRLPGFATGAAFLAGHFHAGALGQILDGLGKVQAVVVHDEAKGIATCAAAEAVIELLVGADAERGGFFLVEWAAGGVVLSGFFQLNTRTHHFDDIGAVEQVINEGLWDQAGHKGFRVRSQ